MKETLVDATVSYTIELGGRFYIVEHVPARVCLETGEEYFAPETAEHIQQIINSGTEPNRVIETPVYEYAGLGPSAVGSSAVSGRTLHNQ